MRKRLLLFMICVVLISCNNSQIQEKAKANLNTNYLDTLKNISNEEFQSTIAKSVTPSTFPFDTILSNCLALPGKNGRPPGGSTLGMIDCYENSAIKLNLLVDKAYSKLYAKLDRKDKKKLKLSQDCWKAFYTAEKDFLYNAFYTWANESKYGHGREHAITQAEWRYDVVKQRLINLIKYDAEIYEGFTDTK